MAGAQGMASAERKTMSEEVVVVRDERVVGYQEPGKFALVRMDEWCRYADKVTLWRGPRKPDEVVETEHLTEVSCTSVQVDQDGFFTCKLSDPQELTMCPQLSEELMAEIEEEAEKAMNLIANRHEAEVMSYVEHESLVDKLGDEWSGKIWAVATFEEGIAVNGENVDSEGDAEHPDGWVELDHLGGRTDGGETEVYKRDIIWPVTKNVSKKLKVKLDENTVKRALDVIYPEHEYVMWASDWGDIEVWVSKAASRRLEAFEKKERQREEQAKLKREEERRRKEAEERREKIRHGGFPEPRDWSPRGRLPGED